MYIVRWLALLQRYNKVERKFAKILERHPYIKKGAKKVYQRINYLKHKDKDFTYTLSEGVSLEESKKVFNIDSETGQYFFGYYDKSPWSEDMKRSVYHEVSETDLKVVVYDKVKGKIPIDKSETWNYQQGCMAQFVPGTNGNAVMYNCLDNGNLVAKIYYIDKGKYISLDYPVQSISPNGSEYLSINYKRLDKLNPEYGYKSKCKNLNADLNYQDDGVWKCSINNLNVKLLVSLEQLINHSYRKEMDDCQHKVNHVIYSPSGENFVFMHRWLGEKGRYSRLLVCDSQGRNLTTLLDDDMVSHYHWINNYEIIVWARTSNYGDKYYRVNIKSKEVTVVGEGELDILGDGHPTISPDGKWLVTDSYPDKARKRHLLLYDLIQKKRYIIGSFFAPWKFDGASRCDLHPRWSPDGNMISIDSAHEGVRKSYIVDVSRVVK